MDFTKLMVRASALPPPSFEEDTHTIEYREDPLTRVRCRINVRRAHRLKGPPATVDLSEIAAGSQDCPFCPGSIEQATPLFVQSLCPEGRIRRGECHLFPNLFPLAEYHAAGTLTSRHFVDLDEFEAGMLIDNMMAAREYLARVNHHNKETRYPIYLWNHLPPSAASLVHPHVQVLVDRRPTLYQQRLLECSRDYFSEKGRSFWQDIVVEEERRGERYIGKRDAVAVIASYAPQGNREVQFIFRERSNFLELGEPEIADFAHCVIRSLHAYKRMGVNSFNLCTFSAPMDEHLPYYRLHAKLISRPVFRPFYRNDTGILERFQYEADIEVQPEVTAKAVREAFEAEG
jgi:UDPglucose--hexose-1-phosphate uridylyltransferase